MFSVFVVLLLCTLAESQFNGCLHETFDSEYDSALSSACSFSTDGTRWIFEVFSRSNPEPPPRPTSNGFIKANAFQHCLTNKIPIRAVPGSLLHIQYYATGSAVLVVQVTSSESGNVVAISTSPLEYDVWSKTSMVLRNGGNISVFLIGSARGRSSLIVDSITYVDTPDLLETCLLTEIRPIGPDGYGPEEWSIDTPTFTIIMLGIIAYLLFLIILSVFFFNLEIYYIMRVDKKKIAPLALPANMSPVPSASLESIA